MKYQRIGKLFSFLNTNRKFGSAKNYMGIRVVSPDKSIETLMFTEKEIDVARERADINYEDMPCAKTLWQKFQDFLHT